MYTSHNNINIRYYTVNYALRAMNYDFSIKLLYPTTLLLILPFNIAIKILGYRYYYIGNESSFWIKNSIFLFFKKNLSFRRQRRRRLFEDTQY